MREVVVIDGVRTPVATFGGALKDMTAQELGRIVVRELLDRTGLDPALVGEVVFGCAAQGSDAPNVARVIALNAGIPKQVPAFTVHRNCASGTQAIVSGYQAIALGDHDVAIVGGCESMSNAPYINRDMRFGKRLRHSQLIDTLWEGLNDPVCNQLMGATAENLVEEFGITREEQDKYAVESHKKAFRATREGKFKDEMMTVMVPKKAAGKAVAPEAFAQDEGINPAINPQMLAMYPTIFKDGGTVTPGNSCPMNDAAAAMLLMTREKAEALGLTPLATIKGYSFAGLEPERMGLGPAYAIPKLLEKLGWSKEDIDLFEINEAFAAQVLACDRVWELPKDRLNVNGGAIALGHPIGATGVRLSISLLKEMARRGAHKGIASLCVGGGMGAAIAYERA
ncbi:MAG: thiolase family protein [Candidatus Sericytochromatia bacterium]|nr:thiolase family protein [Candidatus Sericytochromatia bacterium]